MPSIALNFPCKRISSCILYPFTPMQSLEYMFFKRANEATQPKFDHWDTGCCAKAEFQDSSQLRSNLKVRVRRLWICLKKKLSGNCKFEALWILSLYFIRSFSEDQKLTEEKFTTKKGRRKICKTAFWINCCTWLKKIRHQNQSFQDWGKTSFISQAKMIHWIFQKNFYI